MPAVGAVGHARAGRARTELQGRPAGGLDAGAVEGEAEVVVGACQHDLASGYDATCGRKHLFDRYAHRIHSRAEETVPQTGETLELAEQAHVPICCSIPRARSASVRTFARSFSG